FGRIAELGEAGQRTLATTANVTSRAKLAQAQGKVAEALQMATTKWQEVADQDNRLQDKIELAELLMQIELQRGDLVAASGYGESLVALSNDVRGQVEHIRLGAAWLARVHDGYKQYADILLTRYQSSGDADLLERALAVLESSRGQSLLLQRQLADTHRGDESAERRNLRRRLTEVSNRRAGLPAGSADYEKISIDYFQLLEQYQSNFAMQEQQVAVSAFSMATARAKLGGDKALIEFLCMQEAACKAIVVSDSAMKVFEAGGWQQVSELANRLNATLRTPGADSEGVRRQLGALLLGDIYADPMLNGKTGLLVVVDYPLNNLPFAALTPAANGELVNRFAISTIPSITVYQSAAAEQRQHSLDVAVFADPVFSAGAIQRNAGSSTTFNGWLQSLDRLRWSAVEANNLASLFSGRNVRIYTREQATRENLLKAETRSARILHIASHAYYNESMQDLVGIAFSAADPADIEIDADGPGTV
ncbi:MAG: CHAT domain-containing protein, partial [Pseudomonadota bacterium]